jgi:hypothetical protein
VYFGYCLVGGCGLGIRYISPVSTLIKWFPDRPGMAITGFGGDAFIASPLSVWLSRFSTPTHVGVAETLIVMGAVYCVLCRRGCRNSRSPHLATMATRSSFTTDKHACPEPMHNPLRDDARPLRPWSYTSRSVNTARAHNRVRISRKYCHRHANQETREN